MVKTGVYNRPAGAATDDGRRDFDFLIGAWTVDNQRLVDPFDPGSGWVQFEASLVVAPALSGLANHDVFFAASAADGKPHEGLTLRLFDPETRTWRIFWASNRTPGRLDPPLEGRFNGTHGVFFGDDSVNGTSVRVRFDWNHDSDDRTRARWQQSFSVDAGETWIANWVMELRRTK